MFAMVCQKHSKFDPKRSHATSTIAFAPPRRRMSMMSLELTGTIGPEPKRHKIRQFIEAAKQYAQTKNESLAITINRLLQALSVTIDLSTFDPNNGVVCEFLVSLHELMSNIEQRSSMSSIAWNCVEVLSNACRNPATRNVLIHTYQFLSPLARLLGDQLTHEKKVKLLGLMQELTCGIKISWQIPHLPHLMTTLTKWVESGDEKIVTLSLGVLVNLCYKNLPAIYTLTRCIDMKQFVRICMPLQGTQIEVHVCKLLIILDYLNGKVPEDTILKLIKVTFKTMVEAFNTSDSILLKHIVEFFLDVMKQGSQAEIVAGYRSYDVEVEKLLDVSWIRYCLFSARNQLTCVTFDLHRASKATPPRRATTHAPTIPNAWPSSFSSYTPSSN